MKIFQFLIFLYLVFSFSLPVEAQQLKENEIVVIKGEKFVLHQVRTGETIFSISRDFKVERSVLQEHNPQISEGLNIGEILKIPYAENVVPQNIPVFKKGDPTGFIYHTIRSRNETPYFISKQYGITVEEIFAYNPDVRRIKKGMKLRIPTWEAKVVEETPKAESAAGDTEMQEHIVVSGETLYSISKKYGVAESEILFLNPEAKNLKAGSKIILPKKRDEIYAEVESPVAFDDSKYFQHTIGSGETMWGITHKFNVSAEELIALNPVLKTAFPSGITIIIPINESVERAVVTSNDDALMYVTVQKNETLYSLAEKYGFTVPQIKKYNPLLENRNPVAGEIIMIPKKIETEKLPFEQNTIKVETEIPSPNYNVEVALRIPEECVPEAHKMNQNKTYDVALFLPLFLEANESINQAIEVVDTLDVLNPELVSDTIIERVEPKELFRQFYGNSENFLQFYEGVLVAVDSMQKAGMKVDLHVYDTENNVGSVRKFLNRDEFLETDLIIGPVYQNIQEEVVRVAEKNRIPLVIPFTTRSNLVSNNSQVFQINPSREYIDEKTAEMVAEEYYNSNLIILRTSPFDGTPEGNLVKLIREKLYYSGILNSPNGVRFTVYDFKNEGPSGLRAIFSAEKENVVFIPTTVEGELSVAISNINNLADEFSITLIGSNNYPQRFPSIDLAHFHNLKFKYIYPFWTDYENPATIQFIEKFKRNFKTEPNSFGVQGFDATFYFLNAFNYYGKDFRDCLPYLHVNLVQGNYHFEKVSQFGGFMNKGVSVISFNRDFTVQRKRVKGQPNLVVNN